MKTIIKPRSKNISPTAGRVIWKTAKNMISKSFRKSILPLLKFSITKITELEKQLEEEERKSQQQSKSRDKPKA